MSFLYHNLHKANKKYEILSKYKYCLIKLNILLFLKYFYKSLCLNYLKLCSNPPSNQLFYAKAHLNIQLFMKIFKIKK